MDQIWEFFSPAYATASSSVNSGFFLLQAPAELFQNPSSERSDVDRAVNVEMDILEVRLLLILNYFRVFYSGIFLGLRACQARSDVPFRPATVAFLQFYNEAVRTVHYMRKVHTYIISIACIFLTSQTSQPYTKRYHQLYINTVDVHGVSLIHYLLKNIHFN